MSLWIPCPQCGRRPVTEFRFGGEVPAVPDGLTDADQRDVDRAWMYTNPEGPSRERWFHEMGCRRWLTLDRDTRSDEVL